MPSLEISSNRYGHTLINVISHTWLCTEGIEPHLSKTRSPLTPHILGVGWNCCSTQVVFFVYLLLFFVCLFVFASLYLVVEPLLGHINTGVEGQEGIKIALFSIICSPTNFPCLGVSQIDLYH